MPSISISKGKGSLNHNLRKFKLENVDESRTHLNIILQEPRLEEVYRDLFDEALERYNAKQKRSDRKIKNYLQHIRNSKQEKVFHELVVQIGDHNNQEDYSSLLVEYAKDFERRNPQMRIISAVVHMDEATPHLHLDYVPFITGQKRGLDTRVSNDKAIKQMGYADWLSWKNSEFNALENILERHGLERDVKNNRDRHRTVDGYKQEQRLIEQSIKRLESRQIEIAQPVVKTNPFTKTKTVEYTEYQNLQEQYELLKKENILLSAQNTALMNENHLAAAELSTMHKKRYITQNKELQQENKVLKSQIKELRNVQSENIMLKNENKKLKDEIIKLKNIIKDFYHQSIQKLVDSSSLKIDQSVKFINDIVDKLNCSQPFKASLKGTFKKSVEKDGMGLGSLIHNAKLKAQNSNQTVRKIKGCDIER